VVAGAAVTDAAEAGALRRRRATCPGGLRMRAARWPALAASPTFLAMAFFAGAPGQAMCGTMHGGPLSGMPAMYLMMAAFHVGAWLRPGG